MARFRRRSISSGYLRFGALACSICDSSTVMGSSFYVILIGLIGSAITTFDVIRIINCKSMARNDRPSAWRSFSVPAEVERDLKLMSSILGIEHYTLIMLGAITQGLPDAPRALATDAVLHDRIGAFGVPGEAVPGRTALVT